MPDAGLQIPDKKVFSNNSSPFKTGSSTGIRYLVSGICSLQTIGYLLLILPALLPPVAGYGPGRQAWLKQNGGHEIIPDKYQHGCEHHGLGGGLADPFSPKSGVQTGIVSLVARNPSNKYTETE